jgi:hypothetical protein
LRRIFGPWRSEGTKGVGLNMESVRFLFYINIIGMIKLRRRSCTRHTANTEKNEN